MSNNITWRTLVVDTAGSSNIATDTIKVSKVRWFGATTAGHQAVVQDKNGKAFITFEATGANYTESETFVPERVVEGLKVPTLGSGTLHIYVESKTPIS